MAGRLGCSFFNLHIYHNSSFLIFLIFSLCSKMSSSWSLPIPTFWSRFPPQVIASLALSLGSQRGQQLPVPGDRDWELVWQARSTDLGICTSSQLMLQLPTRPTVSWEITANDETLQQNFNSISLLLVEVPHT